MQFYFFQVIGTLTITNPATPPYQKICKDCKQANIIALPTGDCFCNVCHAKKPSIKSGLLHATITSDDLSCQFVNIEGQWLEAIIHQEESNFLARSRLQQVQLLKSIRIVGKFLLSTSSYLTGFEEDFEPISAINHYTPQRSHIVSTFGEPQFQLTNSNVDLEITPLTAVSLEDISSSKRKLFEEAPSSSKQKKKS